MYVVHICYLIYNNSMIDNEHIADLTQDIAAEESLAKELSYLFGENIVEQARLLDIADLNMTDEMTANIRAGIKQLKQLKSDPEAQRQWIAEQEAGTRLLLCLWVMDMDLLEKIQIKSYLGS